MKNLKNVVVSLLLSSVMVGVTGSLSYTSSKDGVLIEAKASAQAEFKKPPLR
jgi:hypothetical protein